MIRVKHVHKIRMLGARLSTVINSTMFNVDVRPPSSPGIASDADSAIESGFTPGIDSIAVCAEAGAAASNTAAAAVAVPHHDHRATRRAIERLIVNHPRSPPTDSTDDSASA